ncbi:MAG TPA: hypothetical protein VHO01_08230 [Jatrophihabitans sp.]|nr:hypothetical protein [Jatrophihabitans sp.]
MAASHQVPEPAEADARGSACGQRVRLHGASELAAAGLATELAGARQTTQSSA